MSNEPAPSRDPGLPKSEPARVSAADVPRAAEGHLERESPAEESSSHATHWARWASGALAVLLVMLVLRMGWLSDDAFITIRSVGHLLAGESFSVHPDMRVQAYTSPLWALLCIPSLAITGDPYMALMLPGISCSVGLVVLVLRAFRHRPWHGPLVLLALAASGSFLAFSTSGLENSLAHLLAAAFCLERLGHEKSARAGAYWLAAGLFLTRFDLILLVFPSLALGAAVGIKQAVRRAVAPIGAVLTWLGFATFYYGFPYPNTAYAKLNVELSLASRIGRGLEYLLDSAMRDPVVLIVVCCATLLTLRRGVTWNVRALQAGVLFYLAYVVTMGGDFMSGRFLTVCYVVSVLVALHVASPLFERDARPFGIAAVPFAFWAAFYMQAEQSNRTKTECRVPPSGIVDERECYVEHTGLAQNVASSKWKQHGYLEDYRKALKKAENGVVAFDLAGMATYASAERVHIVERFALTDPLLARIRTAPAGHWRAGHFLRPMPDGYLESLRTGENFLKDPCLQALHEQLKKATLEPLSSRDRLGTIFRLNLSSPTCQMPR